MRTPWNFGGVFREFSALDLGAKDIDLAMRAGASFTAGPLEQADGIGLDRVLEKLEELQTKHGENYAPSATLRALVNAGNLGKKTGRGFLEYT